MNYRSYRSRVVRSRSLFSCDGCFLGDGVPRGALEHERHVVRVHGLNKATHCPWCRSGPFAVGGVLNNVGHLEYCFEALQRTARIRSLDYLLRRRPTESPPTATIRPTESPPPTAAPLSAEETTRCPGCLGFDVDVARRSMCGRAAPDDPAVLGSFAETLFLDEAWFASSARGEKEEATVLFDEASGLGSDAAMFVRRFEELRRRRVHSGDDVEGAVWFHVCVTGSAFAAFGRALEAAEPRVGMLPFWCLCDDSDCCGVGTHRHGIVVAASLGCFSAGVWSSVDGGSRCHMVTTAHGLVETIFFLGGSGSGPGDRYCPNRPLRPHARMYLHACVRGGLRLHLLCEYGDRDVFGLLTLRLDVRLRMYVVDASELVGAFGPAGCPVPLLPGGGPVWGLDDRPVGPSLVGGLDFVLSPMQQRFAVHCQAVWDRRLWRTEEEDLLRERVLSARDRRRIASLEDDVSLLAAGNAALEDLGGMVSGLEDDVDSLRAEASFLWDEVARLAGPDDSEGPACRDG